MGRLLPSAGIVLACAACAASTTSDSSDETFLPPRVENSDGAQVDGGGSFDDDAGDPHGGGRPPPDGGTSGDGGGLDSGMTPKSTFTDDFARANGNTIGNGWVPKISKWSLSGGAVLEASNTNSYKDLLVHRPFA